MTVIATASNPRFSVSRVDIDRSRRDLHHRHPARPARAVSGLRAVLHHRRRCAGLHPDLAGLGGTVRPGQVHRRQPARLRTQRLPHHGGVWTGCPMTRCTWSRSRHWRSRRPTAARAPPPAGRSGTWCPTGWCSTSPNVGSTAAAAPAGSGHDRVRRSHGDGDGRGPCRGRQARAGHRRHRRLRSAGHHRLLRDRLGLQRTPGQRDRRRGRGEDAAGRPQAGPPRGHPGGPLGAAGLRRHRRAHPAHRRAQLLRPGPAVAGLPA